MAEWNRAGGDWNHAGAITDWNTVSEWNTAAGGSTGGTAPVITAVTSPRGADIACADETLTITLNDSAGVTSVTVNGVACTNVTLVDATTVTALCPHGFNALYGATGDVVVSNGTASAGYPVTLRPASDDTEWSFTVDYANLDPQSPWAGDAEFSGLTATSQAVLDNTSLPDGLTASMSGTGVVTLSGTATQDQTLGYYIVDATDLAAGPVGTITITVDIASVTFTDQVDVDAQTGMVINIPPVSAVTFTDQIDADVQSGLTVTIPSDLSFGDQVDADTQTGFSLSVTESAAVTFGNQVDTDTQAGPTIELTTGIHFGNQIDVDVQSGMGVEVVSGVSFGDQVDADVQSGLAIEKVSGIVFGNQLDADTQSGMRMQPMVGGEVNVSARFPTGATVTITVYNAQTGAIEAVDSNSMIEVAGTGLYLWDTSKLVNQPLGYGEFVWSATDGTTTQSDLLVIDNRCKEVWQRLDLDPSAPNTYEKTLLQILGAFGSLDKADNGDGTVTVTRTP